MTTDLTLTAGEVLDLGDTYSAGIEFLIQNFTNLPLQITQQSAEPTDLTGPSFSIPVGGTWTGTMPSTGSIYLFSSVGGIVTVGEA